MKTIKSSPFSRCSSMFMFRYESIGLTDEFFQGYIERNHPEFLENQLDGEHAKRNIFLGECRKNGHLVDEEYIPNAGAVWQAMLREGYVNTKFLWKHAAEKIMKAIAPSFDWVYHARLAKLEGRDDGYFPGSCPTVDYFINKHYDDMHTNVNINHEVLDAEISEWLPPSQAAMRKWLIKLEASYGYSTQTVSVGVHSALEMYGPECGGCCTNNSGISYALSDQERQIVAAMYENICQLVETDEFQGILERAIS